MSAMPEVSVVMSVFNGASRLDATLQSILAQQGCDFELVAVNDGSIDETGAILDRYAAGDSRVRVIHQRNTGLTAALICGCEAARGEFIARHDTDDVSMPSRLREQRDHLRSHPEAVLVASAIRFVAPEGEWLYDLAPEPSIDLALDAKAFRAPPFVATMFRRSAYLRAGRFRDAFVVAQDVDMWLRLIELGPCLGLQTVHYETRLTLDGISSRRRDDQLRFCALAIECARARRAGHPDQPIIDGFRFKPSVRRRADTGHRAALHYFVASCLLPRDRDASRRYLRRALRENPLHLRAWLRFMFG